MVYSETLAQRVRNALYPLTVMEENKMFGGCAFMVSGNMTVCVIGDELIVRVGLEKFEASLSKPDVDLFQPTGKPMTGWITVTPNGHQTEEKLKYWIDLALEFVKTLPAK